jgi:hypothetical protein
MGCQGSAFAYANCKITASTPKAVLLKPSQVNPFLPLPDEQPAPDSTDWSGPSEFQEQWVVPL